MRFALRMRIAGGIGFENSARRCFVRAWITLAFRVAHEPSHVSPRKSSARNEDDFRKELELDCERNVFDGEERASR